MPKSASSSLNLEHHIVSDLFQVGHELHLTSGTCMFQGAYQPRQSCCLGIHSRHRVLHQHGCSYAMSAYAVFMNYAPNNQGGRRPPPVTPTPSRRTANRGPNSLIRLVTN